MKAPAPAVIGEPRYVVQRSLDGRTWFTRGSRDGYSDACTYANQLATRGRKGEHFRVVDSANGSIPFSVANPL